MYEWLQRLNALWWLHLFIGHLKMGDRREDVLTAVFQDEDSDFKEESSEEGSDTDEEFDVLSGSGEEMENSSEGHNNTPCGRAAGSTRQRVRNCTIFRLKWEAYEYLDPFERNWVPEYQQSSGILVDAHDFEPVDYFTRYFPNEAFDLMSEETYSYAMQYLDTTVNFSSSSRFNYWHDTSNEEMKAYSPSDCQKPSLEDYWSTFWLTQTDFKRVMPRNRFEILQTVLHFNDISEQIPKGQEGYNALFKIQTFLDICESQYEKVYKPKKCLAIDHKAW